MHSPPDFARGRLEAYAALAQADGVSAVTQTILDAIRRLAQAAAHEFSGRKFFFSDADPLWPRHDR